MRIILTSDSSKFYLVESEITLLTKSQRLKNARKKFSVLLAAAVGSVLIPVLHFVLVPMFLILSIIVFVISYRVKYQFVLKDVHLCFICQTELPLTHMFREDFTIRCGQCLEFYTLK
ncbi:MAG: hypothetical protein AB7F59_13145 [Bdellovibrionales bacterium]